MEGGDVEKQHGAEQKPLLPQGDYRPDVDGLRAFAVICVILYHMNPAWVPAGFAGVDIFFVISGFVVTSSLFGRNHKDGHFEFVVGFFVRRAKRLLPVLTLILVMASTILAYVAPLWDNQMAPKFLKVGMAGMFGNANNWMVFGEVNDYWTRGQEAFNDYHPFLHLWSLGVEEQFYVVYPFMLLAAMGSGMSLQLGTSKARLLNFLALALMSSLTFAWIMQETKRSRESFYLLPSRFWELAMGCMLFPMCSGIQDLLLRERFLARALELVAGALLLASVVITPHSSGFPVPWGLLPTTAALCYIAVGTVSDGTLLNSGLGSKWPVYIGRLSYSMYLWHMPVLAIMTWVTTDGRASILNCCAAGLLTLCLSIASFHLVEEPMRRVKGVSSFHVVCTTLVVTTLAATWIYVLMQFRTQPDGEAWLTRALCLMAAVVAAVLLENLTWSRPLKLIVAAVLLVAACGVSETSIYLKAQNAAEFPTAPGAAPGAAAVLASVHQHIMETGGGCSCSKTPHQVYFPDFAGTKANSPTCFQEQPVNAMSFISMQPVSNCFAPSKTVDLDNLVNNCLQQTDTRAVYLITELETSSLWNAVSAAASGSGLRAFGATWGSNAQGMESTSAALKHVVKPGDVVAYAPHSGSDNSTTADEYKTRIEALRQVSLLASAKLVLFDDVPTLAHPPQLCALKRNDAACTVSATASRAQQQVMRDVVTSFASLDGVDRMDLHDLFCSNDRCNSLIPGTDTVAFADTIRLNQVGNQYLTPFICAFLDKVLS